MIRYCVGTKLKGTHNPMQLVGDDYGPEYFDTRKEANKYREECISENLLLTPEEKRIFVILKIDSKFTTQ